jgi:hypothetical protein
MVRIFVALLMPMCCIIVSFFFCRPWCLQHQMDDRLLDTAIVWIVDLSDPFDDHTTQLHLSINRTRMFVAMIGA